MDSLQAPRPPLATYQTSTKGESLRPENALMVVENNKQMQTLNSYLSSSPQFQQHPDSQHHNAAKTLMELTARSPTDETNEDGTIAKDNSSSSSPSPSPSTYPRKKKKRVYKKRKSTNTIRREQKMALQKEVEELQTKLEAIKLKVLAQRGEDMNKSQVVENSVLREAIEEQHLAMAHVRALLSGHSLQGMGMNGLRPMETRICLSADRDERRRVLYSLRDMKLREAKRFLCARSHGLKPTTPYFQEERYVTEEGDFCLARFEITPLCGVKGGVRAVYDAVLQASYNAEIIISETSGNITVREDDDLKDDSVAQMRLVSQTPDGVLLETNLVHFTDFRQGESEQDGYQGSYAIIAADFVDEDKLYPYRPDDRVRRDATAAMMVTSYRKAPEEGDANQTADDNLTDGDGNRVVVVSRLFCTRVCHTDLVISEQTQLNLRETSTRYASNFLDCLRGILGLPTKCL